MILYHYCKTETLFNIIKNNSLRLNDITRSNDTSELKILINNLYNKILNKYDENKFNFQYDGRMNKEAMFLLIKDNYTMINNLFCNGALSTYAMCFSENGDLLSQWRGYSNDGKGMSIGFYLESIKNFIKETGYNFDIKKIVYVNEKRLEIIINNLAEKTIRKLYNIDINYIRKITNDYESNDAEIINLYFFIIILRIIKISVCFKMDTFKEEKEWRLFITEVSTKLTLRASQILQDIKIGDYNYNLSQKLDFKTEDDKIVPYVNIKLTEFGEKLIKNITLGPNNKTKEFDINLFLSLNGVKVENIVLSKLTYRK